MLIMYQTNVYYGFVGRTLTSTLQHLSYHS
jgi:hypothetical protein